MKTAAYGISTVTLAPCGANGAYPTFSGAGTFKFKAIVKDSLQFNDQAGSDNDIEVEDSDDIYATLQSSAPTKGFTMDTYDMGKAAYLPFCQDVLRLLLLFLDLLHLARMLCFLELLNRWLRIQFFNDGATLARANEFREVCIECMVWESCHTLASLFALRQCDS